MVRKVQEGVCRRRIGAVSSEGHGTVLKPGATWGRGGVISFQHIRGVGTRADRASDGHGQFSSTGCRIRAAIREAPPSLVRSTGSFLGPDT